MAYRGGSQIGFGFQLTPWVQRLLIANGVMFLVTMLAPQVILPLAFTPRFALLQPWTVLTYMFVHGGFWHLFFNMIALFFFGPHLEARWGSTEFLKFYLFCGLGGAAFSFLFAFQNPVIGASAAVYGIMLAFALYWPNMPILIWGILPVPAKYLVGILVVFSFMSAFGQAGGNVAHFAHIGGFVFGLIYVKLLAGGGSGWWKLRQRMAKRRLNVVRDEDDDRAGRRRREPPAPAPMAPDPEVEEVDRILDKVKKQGISSITLEERRILEEASRRRRTN